ncbi:MAG: uroporphyrinogen-III synthase, partial [Candidatus Nanoarchaeia archaeon]
GKKVLITSSVELNNKIAREILRFDGIPIAMPMIKFEPNSEARSIFLGHSPKITNYDWIAITSPASAKIFFIMLNENRYDLRRLPKIMSSGSETTKEILKYGINPDLQAESDFGSDGLLKKASLVLSPGDTVLRICSDKSLKDLSEGLRNRNFKVDEIILYKTIPLKYNNLPEFDAIFFASPSAVEAFKNNFGNDILIEKDVISLGNITADTIKKTFKSTGKIFIPEKSTGIIAIQKYALNYLNEFLWSNAKSLQEDK